MWVCDKGKLMRVPARVTPNSSQAPPLVEEFENTSLQKKNMAMGLDWT
jgi:hypothetical protein